MCRPPRLAGVPVISSLAQPHSPPQRHRRLFASSELLPVLFRDSDTLWRAAGFPLRLPLHSAAFSGSDLSADVMSNLTGKIPVSSPFPHGKFPFPDPPGESSPYPTKDAQALLRFIHPSDQPVIRGGRGGLKKRQRDGAGAGGGGWLKSSYN